MTRTDYLDRLNRRMAVINVNSRQAHSLDVRRKLRSQYQELEILRLRIERMSDVEFSAWRAESD